LLYATGIALSADSFVRVNLMRLGREAEEYRLMTFGTTDLE